jgi:hypothetical protein
MTGFSSSPPHPPPLPLPPPARGCYCCPRRRGALTRPRRSSSEPWLSRAGKHTSLRLSRPPVPLCCALDNLRPGWDWCECHGSEEQRAVAPSGQEGRGRRRCAVSGCAARWRFVSGAGKGCFGNCTRWNAEIATDGAGTEEPDGRDGCTKGESIDGSAAGCDVWEST